MTRSLGVIAQPASPPGALDLSLSREHGGEVKRRLAAELGTPTGAAAAFAALAEGEQHLRVDTRRRVVMGSSRGARGPWQRAATGRPHFGAALPMASTPRQTALEQLRDLPLYVLHSEADRRVPIDDDVKAVERLQARRAPVEFARLPSGDHFDYRLVIAELRNVCAWLETVWQQP